MIVNPTCPWPFPRVSPCPPWFFLALLFVVSPCSAQAQNGPADFLRANPKFVQSFRDAVQKSTLSTVRLQCDGTDTALGTIVGADGWILTKAHDLHGKIVCKLSDGRELVGQKVAVHNGHDLALIKIDAKQLRAVTLIDSQSLRAGSWVASVGLGQDPVAVGVVSVATRKVVEGFLGINVDVSPQGVVVLKIVQNSAALKAGVRHNDIVLSLDGQNFTDPEQFEQRLAGYRPGETITLKVRRGDLVHVLKAKLQSREQGTNERSEYQNRLGSELSNRRGGYSVILQHDSVVKPSDCGGPLVDLQGRVIGINISRAGRVESWAIPAEIARPLIEEMKMGRYSAR